MLILKNTLTHTLIILSLSTENNTIRNAASRIRRTRTHIPAIFGLNGNMAFTNTQKAEAIAESLRNQFTPNPVLDHAFSTMVEDSVQNALNENTENTLNPATPTEVQNYIKGLKKNKAPGEDQISTNMLIYLPQNFILYLVLLINTLLQLNIFPDCWKRAVIVPIPKGGGADIHAPASYHPISLLSCLSKVYEAILVRRLDEFIDSHDIVIPEQFGFRAHHSTQNSCGR